MEVITETPRYRDTIFCSPKTISTMKWDPASYMDHRIIMVKTIMAMFKKRHEERGQKCTHALPLLSRRLELCLCLTASTFEEYFNMYSLKRRMQSLVLLLMSDSTIKPHEFLPPGFGTTRIMHQRKRSLDLSIEQTNKKRKFTQGSVHKRNGIFILDNREDLIQTIYSFLNGTEVVKHQMINTFTIGFLKKCVTCLHLSLKNFITIVQNWDLTLFLQSFPQLQDIRIGPLEEMKNLEFPQVGKFSFQSENQKRAKENEFFIETLAHALEQNAAPKLKRLILSNAFSSSPCNIATYSLMKAFLQGACPQLEYLGYSGNSTRDDGAIIIAKYLNMGACPQLKCLDLRQNFIGVRGLEAIAKALCNRACFRMEALCFGGNILVDDAVSHLLDIVENENCRNIRFLGLEHNFITSRGIGMLAGRKHRGHIVDLSKWG